MFRISWDPGAFEEMQRLITARPDLLHEFRSSLKTITELLTHAADVWGESRQGQDRLGFAGVLSVLVEVDLDRRTVIVWQVQLRTLTEET